MLVVSSSCTQLYSVYYSPKIFTADSVRKILLFGKEKPIVSRENRRAQVDYH